MLVARIEPPGLAFGEPEDRLREMRDRRSRMSLPPARSALLRTRSRNPP